MNLIWHYVKQYKRLLFLALFLATINQVFSLLDPQIFRIIVDKYANGIGHMPYSQFLRGVLLLIFASMGVAFVSRVAKNFQDYYVNVITQRTGAGIYAKGVEHSFRLPYAVFEDQRSGELLQKLQKARTDIQTFIASTINSVFFALIGILFVLIYASTVHWSLGLVFFLMIPSLGWTMFTLSRKIREAQKGVVKQTAEMAGSTTETLRNVELVKSLGLEEQEIFRLNELNDKILGLELNKIKLVRALSFVQGTLINGMRSVLLFLMLWLLFRGIISIGQLFSIFIYSFFIFGPLSELGNVSAQFQEAKASSEALEQILSQPPEPVSGQEVTLGPLSKIEFQKAEFKYASREKPALENVSLSIKGGETIAFVGPSGSGKTTLLKLIAGLYRPTSGKLFLNDIDSKNVDYADFRRRIGLVSQETQLFAGSIRENLLFVNPGASDSDCLKVLEDAAASAILERGNEGLSTKIGEGGIKLSGGERQRLAIARALLRKPELLVFDEATSSLDSLTEKEITMTIKDISRDYPDLMTILVAHRLSTVQHAGTIYVLEQGRIAEKGSHAELINLGGLYAAMWREQVGEGGA